MSSVRPGHRRKPLSVLFALVALAAAGFSASCGGGSATPKFSGNTNVTLLTSSTANDQLEIFGLQLQGLTLTNQAGTSVDLLAGQPPAEFLHVNGGIEPLGTVTIPQGIYTSATATVGSAGFTCVSLTPQGGLDSSTFAYGQTPAADVSVTLPAPLTVTGDSMGLSLNLQVSQSAAYGSCYVTGIEPFAITPTFTLVPQVLSAQATNPANGKALDVNGQVSSVDSANDSFVLAYPAEEAPRTVTVATAAGTAFQGINSFAGLTVGTFVNLDGIVQSDGSLAATRVAVEDATATSTVVGPVLFVSNAIPALDILGQQEQGVFLVGMGAAILSFGNASFQISGALPNLNNLPFTPAFDASSMVAGQRVYLSTTATTFAPEPIYAPVSTVTLLPQTIDGTLSGTSMAGNFTVYTVALAPYDLFPALAVQPGQTTVLNNANEVQAYVDNSTQMLNSQPLAVNGTFRFYGLVFNDHGTLRMDCAQVQDGVSLTPAAAPMAANNLMKGEATVTSSRGAAGQQVVNVVVKPAK